MMTNIPRMNLTRATSTLTDAIVGGQSMVRARSMAINLRVPQQPRAPLPTPGDRQHRVHAARWAADLLALPDLVFLDTETTGLDGRAEVVEVAILDAQGAPLIDTLVRPTGRIPADVTAIHGIDDRMVAGAPRWPEVYPLLTEALSGRTVVVYNADFDLRIIRQVNARHGFPPVAGGWHCAMQGYAAFAGERHARYGGFRWHKLDVAMATFGHRPAPDAHRARSDAAACRLVVHGMAAAAKHASL
jgi:DNA polymerase-3 subunit epsilon